MAGGKATFVVLVYGGGGLVPTDAITCDDHMEAGRIEHELNDLGESVQLIEGRHYEDADEWMNGDRPPSEGST